MDKLNKQELRRLAVEAMPGNWFDGGDLRYSDDKTGEVHGLNVEDERFIAAANPAAILSLLDELEQYRKDAQRLEWILAEQCIIRAQNGTGFPSVFSLWWVSLHEGQREWYATERDAIDAAMAKEGGANG